MPIYGLLCFSTSLPKSNYLKGAAFFCEMALLTFETLRFQEENGVLHTTLYNIFTLDLPLLGKIIEKNTLLWDGERDSFHAVFTAQLPTLHNTLTKHPAVFIHRQSGIPLMGSLAFGIVDRGTNMLEIKPITGCNINCTFCSVDEGQDTKKIRDYVVEREYLIQELEKVLQWKKEPLDIWLNTQGEPTLYSEIVGLIRDMKQLPFVHKIALITNGTLLSQQFLTALKDAGLTQLDISLNAIHEEQAQSLAGTSSYNGKRVQEMIVYALQIGLDVILAPVYLPGINEKDIEKILVFAESVGCKKVYIQNFLPYRFGRNPVKSMSWEKFDRFLREMQEMHPSLELFAKEHTCKQTKPLPKPFRKGDHVRATIVALGRYPSEFIAAAQGRCITIRGEGVIGKEITVEITGDKDNVFYGKKK